MGYNSITAECRKKPVALIDAENAQAPVIRNLAGRGRRVRCGFRQAFIPDLSGEDERRPKDPAGNIYIRERVKKPETGCGAIMLISPGAPGRSTVPT